MTPKRAYEPGAADLEQDQDPRHHATSTSEKDALAELLLRHYAEPDSLLIRARQRIEEIFRDNPPDATERLLKAAEYLKIDGSKRHAYAERALAVWHQRQESS